VEGVCTNIFQLRPESLEFCAVWSVKLCGAALWDRETDRVDLNLVVGLLSHHGAGGFGGLQTREQGWTAGTPRLRARMGGVTIKDFRQAGPGKKECRGKSGLLFPF